MSGEFCFWNQSFECKRHGPGSNARSRKCPNARCCTCKHVINNDILLNAPYVFELNAFLYP
jgi:hypothetical protein